MKKLSYLFLGAAGLILASCSNEELVKPGSADGLANVTISLDVPQISTRADYSDGTTATVLQYAVYLKDENGNYSILPAHTHSDAEGNPETINLQKNVEFQLVTGSNYRFIFWADQAKAPYKVTFGESEADMKVDYKVMKANKEEYDAFYACVDYTVTGDASIEAHLYRPFAQINVGTNDYKAAHDAGYDPVVSKITVDKAYKTLNLFNGSVSDGGQVEYNFAYNAFDRTQKFPVDNYEYMVMVYALVAEDQELVKVNFDVNDKNDGSGLVRGNHELSDVPVRRNYRTNIFGALLTSHLDVNVIIEPAFNEPGYDINHDGVEYDEDSDTYTITNAHGLQWLARMVNKEAGTRAAEGIDATVKYGPRSTSYGPQNLAFKGQNVELASNIDLEGFDFQPIGYNSIASGSPAIAFGGNFDGKKYTISNLTVKTEKNQNAGLFGGVSEATIKNVKLTNVNISGHYSAAAVVGYAWNSIIEYCEVDGGTIVSTPWLNGKVYDDGNNVAGIVGYLNGYPLAAAVNNSKVSNVEISGYRKVGGIVGALSCYSDHPGSENPSVTVKDNSISNINLTANMTETNYKDYPKQPEINFIYGSNSTNSKFADKADLQDNVAPDDSKITIIKGIAPEQTLEEALTSAQEGDVIGLPAGSYNSFPSNKMKKGVTVVCEEGTVFTQSTNGNLNGGTLKGATFTGSTSLTGTVNGNFIDCDFTGGFDNVRWCYSGETCYFENCTFAGSAYACHFDGGKNPVTFKNCTFSGFNAMGGAIPLLTYDNCTFKPGKSSYNGLNAWGETVMIDCKWYFNGKGTEWIDAKTKLTMRNCTINDVVASDESVADYFVTENYNNVIFE